ncbi:MAG: hypothetical protein LBP59_00900 [Planctomycetaceae bacterium]|jgi:hypothetical protein|nr:hypothetical protein [Planctomycetaceae bacterium]
MKSYRLKKALGMTLMEVIAAMFIICIGLLSVLMVIPYGAFQVAKARNAEFISNMLAAGVEDLQINEWDKNITEMEGIGKPPYPASYTVPGNPFDNQDSDIEIYIIDPFVPHPLVPPSPPPPSHVLSGLDENIFVLNPIAVSEEMMIGKDDIHYILKENERTEIRDPRGSKQYSYFITTQAREFITASGKITFTTDLLGCYKRVNSDMAFTILSPPSTLYTKAARFTIPSTNPHDGSEIDFSATKYVFITWSEPPVAGVTLNRGEWCKIVNVSKNEAANTFDIIVLLSGNAEEIGGFSQVIIFPGVQYHKQLNY